IDAAQRRGFGRELVRSTVAGLRELGIDDMIIWVLRDNQPARTFYERLGGAYVRAQPITIGSVTLEGVSDGWRRLDDVRYCTGFGAARPPRQERGGRAEHT